MPYQFGQRSASSFQTSSGDAYSGHDAPSAAAMSQTMRQSSRASPGQSSAFRTRFTRRSVFVNVPSFSANDDAGSTTSAYFRVESFRKMSCETMNSQRSRPSSTWCAFGSVCAGFSPTR